MTDLPHFSYLRSPVVELIVGSGPDRTLLTAHQALLVQSPFLAAAIAETSVYSLVPISFRTSSYQFSCNLLTGLEKQGGHIDLIDEDLDAISCFLEYLYTGEYFPHKTSTGTLEADPSTMGIDNTGEQLLKHARVYTLAEKFGISVRSSADLL